MPARPRTVPALLIAAGLLVSACQAGGASGAPSAVAPSAVSPSSSAAAAPESEPPDASTPPVPLVVGLGFNPSVQFAPFYLADQAGYYAEAGLDVEFQNKIDPDLVTLVGQGAVDIGLADGTSVIPAASNGIPIKYVATIYGKFPSIVFAKSTSGIETAADLAGRKVGIPGRFGSSWIMLQALLGSAGLTADDIELSEIGFTQMEAVSEGLVEAATGFANNEPVALELSGTPVSVLHVDDITPLPGNGLIVGTDTLETKHDAIAAFVAATLRAMEEIAVNPEIGLDAAITAVPELGTARDTQAAILDATIDVWRGPVQATNRLGAIEPADWQATIDYLTTLDLVPNPVTVDDVVDTGFLPAD